MPLVLWYVLSPCNAHSPDQIPTKNDLLRGLGAKQPKTVAGCIFALKEIVRWVFHFVVSRLSYHVVYVINNLTTLQYF
jgi:hypothetical protein